jgi:ABC-type glycerol-3-phosphate transport system substrate-binding protein
MSKARELDARERTMGDRSSTRISRRQILQLLTVSSAGALLAACSGGSTPAPTAAPAKPAEAAKPAAPAAQPAATSAQPAAQQAAPAAQSQAGKTIKAAVLNNFKGEALEKALPDFEKATGIKVQFDKLPLENLVDKLTVSFAGGSSDYDIAMMDEPWIAGLASYLLPLDDLAARDKFDTKQYIGAALKTAAYQNAQVALPLDPNVQMVWYRKDLLDAKGLKPPTNLDELIAAAEKLHDPANDVAGISIAAKKDAQTMVAAITLLWKEGGEVITPDGKFGFDSPAGLKAFETYQRVMKVAPQGSLAYGGAEQLDAFYQGKVATILYWASAGPNAIDPSKSKVADKLGWTSIPNAMSGVWEMGIPKNSKNQDAAWEYLKWQTGPQGSLPFTNFGGGHSATSEVLKSTDFVKKYPWAPDLQKALEASKARPQTPHWTAIQTAIVDMSTAILSGQQTAPAATKAAAEQLAPYLKS